MIRVLAFIEALGVTGAARNLFDTASAVDLRIATYRRTSAPPLHHDGVDAFVGAAHARGIEVIEIAEARAGDPLLPFHVARAIRDANPDVVQSHNVKSHALVAVSRLVERFRWVAFHHGYTDTDLKMRVYNQVDRWTLRHADAVVIPCAAFAGDIRSMGVGRDRIAVVHNAVTVRAPIERQLARRQLGLQNTTAIVAVGRLSREKGHDLLVDACASLRAPGGVTVVIAGDGPERDRLARRALDAGVALRLDGFQADVAAYYAAADVFVLPSRSEGSPNALLEAMAAGCAIVAARAGGVPEILEDGHAGLLAAPDADAMRAALQRMLASANDRTRFGANARHAAVAFSPERRTAAIRAVYDRVLQRGRRLAWAAQ